MQKLRHFSFSGISAPTHTSLQELLFLLPAAFGIWGEYALKLSEKDRSKLSFSFLPDLLTTKTADTSTFTFQLWQSQPEDKEPVTEAKKTRRVVQRKKKLEVDTEWIQNKIEVSMAVHGYCYFVQGLGG